MKILHLVPKLGIGGLENVAKELTKFWAKMGHEIILASGSPIPEQMKQFVNSYYSLSEVRLAPPKIPFDFRAHDLVKAISEILRKEKIDVLITHGSLIKFSFSRHINIPCFTIVHGTYANEIKFMHHHPLPPSLKLRYMARLSSTFAHEMLTYFIASRKCDVNLVAVSRSTKEELTKYYVRKDRIHVVLNGVNKAFFKPMNKEIAKSILEKKYQLVLRAPVLLHIGMNCRKGTHIFIKSLGLLNALENRKFTAIIVGKCPLATFMNHMKQLIHVYGLGDRIIYLESIPDEEMPLVYNAADVVVQPSFSEGAPLSVAEALATGTPVVATDVGGIKEYLCLTDLEQNLVSINKYDFSAHLALKILEVLENPKKPDIEKVPSWEDVSKRYIELFELFL